MLVFAPDDFSLALLFSTLYMRPATLLYTDDAAELFHRSFYAIDHSAIKCNNTSFRFSSFILSGIVERAIISASFYLPLINTSCYMYTLYMLALLPASLSLSPPYLHK